MSIFESIFLGIIQGLTEFIPVSSSGHLTLIPQLLNMERPSTTFVLFIQFGTLFALLYFFRKIILKYTKALMNWKNSSYKNEVNVVKNVVIATIPALIIGVVVDKVLEKFYDSPDYLKISGIAIAIAMIIVGVIFLLLTEKEDSFKEITEINTQDSVFVGLFQTFAFFRGVSRSGITMVAGNIKKIKRKDAAEFSFLMSIPISIITSVYSLYQYLKLPKDQLSNELGLGIVGMTFSFIFGIIAIRFLLNYLQKNSLKIFGYYRIALGIIAILILVIAK